MARTITETFKVFTIAELSETAKQKAYEEFLEHGLFEDWAEFVIDDAKTIGALIGINIDKVYFTGFSSQGDGACFAGSYEYAIGWKKALHNITQDRELFRIGQELQNIQTKYFYKLSAKVSQSGYYMHSGCTSIEVTNNETGNYIEDDSAAAEITSLLRDFMDWIYKSLETEYDYQTSEKAFIEEAEANEREYYEDGTMYF